MRANASIRPQRRIILHEPIFFGSNSFILVLEENYDQAIKNGTYNHNERSGSHHHLPRENILYTMLITSPRKSKTGAVEDHFFMVKRFLTYAPHAVILS